MNVQYINYNIINIRIRLLKVIIYLHYNVDYILSHYFLKDTLLFDYVINIIIILY